MKHPSYHLFLLTLVVPREIYIYMKEENPGGGMTGWVGVKRDPHE